MIPVSATLAADRPADRAAACRANQHSARRQVAVPGQAAAAAIVGYDGGGSARTIAAIFAASHSLQRQRASLNELTKIVAPIWNVVPAHVVSRDVRRVPQARRRPRKTQRRPPRDPRLTVPPPSSPPLLTEGRALCRSRRSRSSSLFLRVAAPIAAISTSASWATARRSSASSWICFMSRS